MNEHVNKVKPMVVDLHNRGYNKKKLKTTVILTQKDEDPRFGDSPEYPLKAIGAICIQNGRWRR